MATLTITATAPQAARISHAVGVRFKFGGDATTAQVEQVLRTYLKDIVISVEKEEAATTPLDLT